MSTSARMLRLLSLLQTHRYWAGRELAERLEVSVRTLRRDVDRLRELGYPVNAGRGVGGGYQLRPGAELPPLLIDDEEAVAIAMGLRTVAGGSIAGIEETSLRALTKLAAVMPARLRRRVDTLQAFTVPALTPGPTVDAAVLTILAQACRDEERVQFRYAPPGRRPHQRTAEPLRLVSHGRRWYLVAWDLTRCDWRTFRIDRLADPLPTGERFRPRDLPGGDPAAFVQAAISGTPRVQVLVEVQAPAAHVQRLIGHWATVEASGADECRVRMETESMDWPVMALASIGAEFRVVEPAELADHLRVTAGRFLRAVGAPAH